MAIKSYTNKNGQMLWKASVHVRDPKNPKIRMQKTKFACISEKEARREEARLLRECEKEIAARENEGIFWSEVVEKWERNLYEDISWGLAATTRTDYIAALRSYTERWFRWRAREINRADVRDVLNQMRIEGRSRKHQMKVKGLIHQVFVFGVENRLIKGLEVIPTLGMKIDVREEEKKPEILTLKEIRTLLFEAKRLKSSWYHHWAMALLTGMRSGELYALQWTDIDFENRMISVNKSYCGRFRKVKNTKSGDWRAIPISSELFSILEELKFRPGSANVLPHSHEWCRGEQARELRKFCEGIGLPSIRFHTLRACFATQLIRNGVAPIQVMKIGGWKDLKTMQRYIRIAGIEINGATESLKVLPEAEVMARAVSLFTEDKIE